MSEPILEVRDLAMHFPVKRDWFGRPPVVNRAVDGVDLTIRPGETLGLVGESGCGKTTLGRCIIRTHKPVTGQIHYRRPDGQVVDLPPSPPGSCAPTSDRSGSSSRTRSRPSTPG